MDCNAASSAKTGLQAIPLRPYDLQCIEQVHQLFSQDPTSKITIEDLAGKIGINRRKLIYGFKQVYGLTISEFQEQQRMEKAELLLSTTHKSIRAIASITRYCTPSRFCVVFKKNYGLTPLQFRKQLNNQNRPLLQKTTLF
jgi:AraC-like DNA-binding protein